MHKKLISLILLLGFTLTPVSVSRAETADTDTESLTKQLSAIHSYLARTYTTALAPLTPDEMRATIREGVEWLKKAQEENGHFRYEYVPYEGRYRTDDNMVRQAGALYALGEVFQKSDADAFRLGTTIERSINYFESISKESAVGNTTFKCIPKSDTSKSCPLGATSLALIGLLSYLEQSGSNQSTYRELKEDYLSYILAMQKETGGFRNTHTVGSTRHNDAESPFSNGEALLALARSYAYDPDPEVKDAIDAAFSYLKVQPYDANLYLWMMAALKDMHSLWPSDEYVSYAKGFTEWRMARAVQSRDSKRNYCAYAEGLASVLSIVDVKSAESGRIRNELDRLNRKHVALQITEADTYRIIAPEGKLVLAKLKDPEWAQGGFLTEDSEPTQRIDFTQHCINTYLQTLVDVDGERL